MMVRREEVAEYVKAETAPFAVQLLGETMMVRLETERRVCILKLRVGACLTAPSKRMVADVHDASRLYNQARNSIIRAIERHIENSNPETFSTYICTCGAAEKKKAAKLAGSAEKNTCHCKHSPYQIGIATVPTLAGKIVSAAVQEVSQKLRAKVPYGHPGRARYVWQAMLGNEASRPCYRGAELPVPCQDAEFIEGKGGFTLRFPVWSKKAGRNNLAYTCRIPTNRLSPGYKRILRKVSSGEWKLCDSKLHYHEGKSRRKPGGWFIHLAYKRPQESLGLDLANVAELALCDGAANKPFRIDAACSFKGWEIGDSEIMKNEFARLETRRKVLRERHRDKSGSQRGHGRQKPESTSKSPTRAMRNLCGRVQWKIVAEVVRFCERFNCGTVTFSEPSMWKRANCWFSAKGVQWDWTSFMGKLKHKLWVCGIVLRESEGGSQNSGDSSQTTSPNGTNGNGNGVVNVSAKSRQKKAAARKGDAKPKRRQRVG